MMLSGLTVLLAKVAIEVFLDCAVLKIEGVFRRVSRVYLENDSCETARGD